MTDVGSPQQRSAVNPFELSTGGAGGVNLSLFNVQSYGAVADGVTDAGAGIIAAAAALQAAGGGILFFPPSASTYRIFTIGTVYGILASFAGCNGVKIIGYGATLEVDPARVFLVSYGTCFVFRNCTNVAVDGFTAIGVATASDVAATAVKGIEFTRCYEGCVNVDMPNNKVTGMIAGLSIDNGAIVADPTKVITRNVTVGNLDITNCWYGVNGQYGPENMTIENLRTNRVHRSLFIYGARNVFARVDSKDPSDDDVLLQGVVNAGVSYNLDNIEIEYIRKRDTALAGGSAAGVSLSFTVGPSAIRNVKIRLDVKYPGAGTTPGLSTVLIRKPDNLTYGSVLENIEVSGRIENFPNYGGFGIIGCDPSVDWPSGDVWRNIHFHDLSLVNTGFARLFLGSLVGPLIFDGVFSTSDFILTQGTANPHLPPTAGSYEIRNSSFPNLYAPTASQDLGLEYIALGPFGGTTTVYAAWAGHTLTNAQNGGAVITGNLPAAVPGLRYHLVRTDANAFRLDPNGAESIRGGGAGKYLSLDSTGACVVIECFVAGMWEITSSNGTISFEP